MSTLDVTIVNISLPTMSQDFGVSSAEVSWVIMAYLLIMCSFLPAFGRLGDIIGYRAIFSAGYLVFIIGSFLCGISENIGLLIGSRLIQGTGASMLSALTSAIVMTSLPLKERGRGLGIIAMFASLGLALGPVIGGYITTSLTWHWIFFINVPVGIAGLLIALHTVRGTVMAGDARFDAWGAVLIFFTLLGFIFLLNQGRILGWTSPLIIGVCAGSLIFLYLFIRRETTISYRIFNVALFRARDFLFANISSFLMMLAFSGVLFALPFYLELSRGFSAEKSGLILAIPSVAIVVMGPLMGSLTDRIGSKIPCTVSAAAMCAGFFIMAFYGIGGPFPVFCFGLLLIGVGVGGFIPSNSVLVMMLAPRSESGAVSSMMLTIRNTGSTFGVAVFEAVFAFVVFSLAGNTVADIREMPPGLFIEGFSVTFFAGMLISAAALAVILVTRNVIPDPTTREMVSEGF